MTAGTADDRRVECPFCLAIVEAFLPFGLDEPVLRRHHVVGGGLRPNAMCPTEGCWSLDRERLVFLFLKHRTTVLTRAVSILHVAPERALGRVLRARPHYTAADLIPAPGVEAMDITDIRYPDAAFDVVICNHVLEHVVDDGRAMREIGRVLRPSGFAILQVPIASTLATTFEAPEVVDPRDRARTFGQCDHVRLYGADYVTRLVAAGFAVEVHNARDVFGDAFCARHALCAAENVHLARPATAASA